MTVNLNSKPDWNFYKDNFNEQNDEISALKSFYENTDIFNLVEEASIEDSERFILQFKISPNVGQKNLNIEVWLAIENHSENDESSNTACARASTEKPLLERSLSGKNVHTTLKCDHLPPLIADITLPDNYPSHNPPSLQLSSFYLSSEQLSRVCLKLDEIWSENFNMCVLFTWLDWLQNNLIEFLDLCEETNKVVLTPLNHSNEISIDKRAKCLFLSLDDLIFQFLRYNFVEEVKQFRNTIQNCLICFDEKLGMEFFRLDCKHHYCVDCMSSMCQIHVKDGTIQLLKCPTKGCETFVSEEIMRQVLNAEDFERWERLLLQRTLDTMDDIIFCPKCSKPITVDENDTHAVCMYCKIDYCKLCKDTWHTGQCLTGEEKIEKRVKHLNLTSANLLDMTDEQIRKCFQNSQIVFDLKKKIEDQTAENENVHLLSKYRRCPKCKAPFEKHEGCNKVTCICGCIICYICGKVITGYEHFESGHCNLWSKELITGMPERRQHQAQRVLQRILVLAPDQRRNTISCPTCGQQSIKMERNNHIKCWLCQTNFCFTCKKVINGNVTFHFRQSTCKQHSD